AARGQVLAVRAERDNGVDASRTLESGPGLAGRYVPQGHGVIRGCNGELAAVAWVKGQNTELVGVTDGGADRLAAGRIPDSHRLVPGRRSKKLAVGTVGHAEHRGVLVATVENLITGRCVPDANLPVVHSG